MRIYIVLCTLVLGAYCAPMLNEQLDHQWILFKQNHQKQYESSQEEITRRMIWEANLAKIKQHNTETMNGMHSFILGMNQFGDLTHEEFLKRMNIKPFVLKVHSDQKPLTASPDVTVPRAVDWRDDGAVAPVRDQGPCGSSYAISATGSLEGQFYTQYKEFTELSIQNILDCSADYGNDGCSGGTMDRAFAYIKANGGIDTEKSYPYEAKDGTCRFNRTTIAANCTGVRDIESGDENALTYAIAIRGPISVAIDASRPAFQFYKSGVYNDPECSNTTVNHAALAVGFNVTSDQLYYTVRNSWGRSWGIDGYVWMSRQKDNQCGIATNASWPLVY